MIDELKALIDQAYAIIDSVKSKYMNKVEWVESYDVYREEEARRGFVCKLSLYNLYINLIRKKELFDSFLDYIQEKSSSIDFNKLYFKGFFAPIKNIIKQLKEKGTNPDELHIFMMIYGAIVTKGFGMCQVTYK